MEIRITTIIFDKGLRPEDVSAFRGAVLTILPDDKILHNHSEETVYTDTLRCSTRASETRPA